MALELLEPRSHSAKVRIFITKSTSSADAVTADLTSNAEIAKVVRELLQNECFSGSGVAEPVLNIAVRRIDVDAKKQRAAKPKPSWEADVEAQFDTKTACDFVVERLNDLKADVLSFEAMCRATSSAPEPLSDVQRRWESKWFEAGSRLTSERQFARLPAGQRPDTIVLKGVPLAWFDIERGGSQAHPQAESKDSRQESKAADVPDSGAAAAAAAATEPSASGAASSSASSSAPATRERRSSRDSSKAKSSKSSSSRSNGKSDSHKSSSKGSSSKGSSSKSSGSKSRRDKDKDKDSDRGSGEKRRSNRSRDRDKASDRDDRDRSRRDRDREGDKSKAESSGRAPEAARPAGAGDAAGSSASSASAAAAALLAEDRSSCEYNAALRALFKPVGSIRRWDFRLKSDDAPVAGAGKEAKQPAKAGAGAGSGEHSAAEAEEGDIFVMFAELSQFLSAMKLLHGKILRHPRSGQQRLLQVTFDDAGFLRYDKICERREARVVRAQAALQGRQRQQDLQRALEEAERRRAEEERENKRRAEEAAAAAAELAAQQAAAAEAAAAAGAAAVPALEAPAPPLVIPDQAASLASNASVLPSPLLSPDCVPPLPPPALGSPSLIPAVPAAAPAAAPPLPAILAMDEEPMDLSEDALPHPDPETLRLRESEERKLRKKQAEEMRLLEQAQESAAAHLLMRQEEERLALQNLSDEQLQKQADDIEFALRLREQQLQMAEEDRLLRERESKITFRMMKPVAKNSAAVAKRNEAKKRIMAQTAEESKAPRPAAAAAAAAAATASAEVEDDDDDVVFVALRPPPPPPPPLERVPDALSGGAGAGSGSGSAGSAAGAAAGAAAAAAAAVDASAAALAPLVAQHGIELTEQQLREKALRIATQARVLAKKRVIENEIAARQRAKASLLELKGRRLAGGEGAAPASVAAVDAQPPMQLSAVAADPAPADDARSTTAVADTNDPQPEPAPIAIPAPAAAMSEAELRRRALQMLAMARGRKRPASALDSDSVPGAGAGAGSAGSVGSAGSGPQTRSRSPSPKRARRLSRSRSSESARSRRSVAVSSMVAVAEASASPPAQPLPSPLSSPALAGRLPSDSPSAPAMLTVEIPVPMGSGAAAGGAPGAGAGAGAGAVAGAGLPALSALPFRPVLRRFNSESSLCPASPCSVGPGSSVAGPRSHGSTSPPLVASAKGAGDTLSLAKAEAVDLGPSALASAAAAAGAGAGAGSGSGSGSGPVAAFVATGDALPLMASYSPMAARVSRGSRASPAPSVTSSPPRRSRSRSPVDGKAAGGDSDLSDADEPPAGGLGSLQDRPRRTRRGRDPLTAASRQRSRSRSPVRAQRLNGVHSAESSPLDGGLRDPRLSSGSKPRSRSGRSRSRSSEAPSLYE